MIVGFKLPAQSMTITTNVVRSNPTKVRCTWYNIMWSSLSVTCDRSVVFSTNKTDHHKITEILLRVALSTIKPTNQLHKIPGDQQWYNGYCSFLEQIRSCIWASVRLNQSICYFFDKHAASRRKSEGLLAWNQTNVSEWRDMSTSGLLFKWASSIKIQLSMLV
jgi:hypothetical protein